MRDITQSPIGGLLKKIAPEKTYGIYMLLLTAGAFLAAFIAIKVFMKLLPKDQGRKFAVNGALSEGKPRGAGIIMITVFTVLCTLFVKITAETAINLGLIYAAMLTGFFDDAASKPWGELKKGLLDLAITVGLTANFIYHNDTDIFFAGHNIHINTVLFALLAMVLIWTSINVTNCCDGVDGMCGTLSIITIFLLTSITAADNIEMPLMGRIMTFVLLGYLWFNCSPSKILMGDAGSRAIGVFIAIMALKSANPFMYIPCACMIIIDGGLGLLKLSCRRFLKMKNFMENIRTPIHDHWRKNLGIGDTQVVVRFALIQLIVGLAFVHAFY